MASPSVLLGGLLLAVLSQPTTGAAAIAEPVSREERLSGEATVPPYHDGEQWQWKDLPPMPPPAGCMPSAPAETLIARPRVDLFRCQAGFPKMLVGIGADDTRWSRELRHPSGTHRIDLYVGSANPRAITLDTLEVIDPASGRAVRFAPMKLIDTPPRAIPIVRVNGPVACPTEDADCFGAVAEGNAAGLLRIRRDGRVTVLEEPRSRWFAPIAITDIVIDEGLLLAAEEWRYRGTKWVRFAVVDAASGRRLFEERHGEDRVVSAPRIVPGPPGEFVFHYRDATAGRQVAIRYRIADQK